MLFLILCILSFYLQQKGQVKSSNKCSYFCNKCTLKYCYDLNLPGEFPINVRLILLFSYKLVVSECLLFCVTTNVLFWSWIVTPKQLGDIYTGVSNWRLSLIIRIDLFTIWDRGRQSYDWVYLAILFKTNIFSTGQLLKWVIPSWALLR